MKPKLYFVDSLLERTIIICYLNKDIVKNILLIFFLCFNVNLFGQNIYEFVSASKLNLRTAPNLSSKVLKAIDIYSKIQVIGTLDAFVEIDGIGGYWKKISHENDIGYVFGGYLLNRIIENDSDTFDLVLDFYGELNYNPSLNWYGIFSTPRGDKLEEIIPQPYLNLKYKDVEGISFFKSNSDTLLFSIGTKTKLSPGIKSVKKYYNNLWLTDDGSLDLILFNEGEFRTGHQLVVKKKKKVNGIYGQDSFTEYKLYYLNAEDLNNRQEVLIYSPKGDYFNQIPALIWYGDLDSDGLPEILFSVNGDNRGIDYEFFKVYKDGNKLKVKKLFSKRPAFAGGC